MMERGTGHSAESQEQSLYKDEIVWVGVDSIPYSLIEHASPNPYARALLRNADTYLASSAYFTDHATASVPMDVAHFVHASHSYHGRVQEIERFNGIEYGEKNLKAKSLSIKGGFLSGDNYRAVKKTNKPFLDNGYYPGLETTHDVQGDMLVANALIQHGYRASLFLGSITLDRSRYRSWLLKKWGGHTTALGIIDTVFDRMKTEGHTPAISFRLGGTLARVKPLGMYSEGPWPTRVFRTKEGLHVIQNELSTNEKRLSFISDLSGYSPEAITHTLTRSIRPMYQPSADELLLLRGLYTALCAENASALQRLYLDDTQPIALAAPYLFARRNVDTALFDYDFDDMYGTRSYANRPKLDTILSHYKLNSRQTIAHLMQRLEHVRTPTTIPTQALYAIEDQAMEYDAMVKALE